MSISKHLRFEVFKRDSFTCQYCGKKAPDVILHADHVHPRAEGGTDDMLNLVTACVDCNLGKGARRLDDASAVEKQRRQLDELQERREQIDMMMEWQRSLVGIEADATEQAAQFWNELTGFTLTDQGKRKLKRNIKKFGLNEVLEAMRISSESYLAYDKDGEATAESVEIAIKKVGAICSVKEAAKTNPHLRDTLYIRAIIRNQLAYINESEAREWLEAAFSWDDVETERLKSIARSAGSWTNWKTRMSEYIRELRGDPPL